MEVLELHVELQDTEGPVKRMSSNVLCLLWQKTGRHATQIFLSPGSASIKVCGFRCRCHPFFHPV